MITMSDIAREAGVSRATVSYVLNKRHNGVRIPEDTRQHILKMAAELGYRPNELARAMATGKNRVLGFVANAIDYEPNARVLAGAIDEAGRHDYFIKVFPLYTDHLDESIVENCIKQRLAGIIVYSIHEYVDQAPQHAKIRDELKRHGISVAIVGANMYLNSDDEHGYQLAVNHLRELGHSQIGFLSGVPKASIAAVREKAWRAVMKQSQLPAPKNNILYGAWEVEPTAQALRSLCERPAGSRLTALCCVTDLAASVALRAARRIGLRIPEDLSLVGFGGLSAGGWTDPPLTTIDQSFEQLGAAAVRSVLQMVEEPTDNKNTPDPYSPNLVIRESTAVPTRI